MPKISIISLLLVWLVLQFSNAMAVTVSVRVSASNDDAEERISDGNMLRDGPDLELGYDDFQGGLQVVGMRFRSVSIPQGATINSAYLEFETDETDSGTTNLVIYGEDGDTASQFASTNGDISSRSKTSASVTWSPSAWNSVDQLNQTSDIGTIIKEIVDRPGWSSGNNLVIIIEPGAGCTNGICERTAEAWDGESAAAPLLVVDYSIGSALSCDTFRDNFSTSSFGNQDGTLNWASNWIETGDNNNAGSGDIEINNSRLELEGDGSGGGRVVFGNAPSIEREANLSTYTTATLTFNYSESGTWESSDDIEVWVSSDGGSNWNLIQTFTNDQGSTPQLSTLDISGYISSNTRIAFVEKANSSSEIFRIDNVQIEACATSISAVPVIDWHLDDLSWSAVTDEVLDSSGNSNHATVAGGSGLNTIAQGEVCRGGEFDGADDYIVSNDIFALLRTTATMSFWIKTTQTGNDLGWQAPGVSGTEQFGGTDDIFWGWLDASGRIGISVANDFSSKSTIAINNGVYHHIVLSRDAATGAYKIYVDGVLDNSGTIGSGDIATGFSSLGRIEDTGGSPEYFQGDLDEVIVFDTILSDSDVNSIYTNQLAGNNFDGSARSCPAAPPAALLEYRFEESTWNGTTDEIIDYSGNGHHARVNNSSTPATASPAIIGDPGTCGYAFQNDGSIQVTGLPLNTTTAGIKTTVTFWMNWDGTNSVMPVGWNFHDIWIVAGAIGFNSWNNDVYGISSAGLANGWHHISAEFTNANLTANRLYVDGVEQTLSQMYGSPNNSNANVNSQLRVGGVSNSASYDFHGSLDEVRVYEGALTTAQVNTIMAETHPCSTSSVDHYAIAHSGLGVTCEAESVTVSAHDAGDSLVAPSSSTSITLSTSIANDGWALHSGNGIFTPPDQYTFDGTETSVVFWLTKTTATTPMTMDIDVSDGTSSDPDNAGSEDPALEFRDSGFRFYADNSFNTIGTQIAGKNSNVTPGAQVMSLRSVVTDTNTGACTAGITGQRAVQMGFECINPANCKTNNGVTITDSVIGGAGNTLADNAQGSSANSSAVDLTFDASGIATWNMNYPDAGQIRLHVSYLVPANPPNPSITLSGTSNTFTNMPAGLCVSSPDANASCTLPYESCSIFSSAGSPFNLDIRAVAWESSGESNTDFCSGNNTTPNFQLNGIGITQNLVAPMPGSVGVAGVTSFDMSGADDGDHNINNQTISEVGVFTYTASPPAYFGEAIPSSTSADIGRFRPAAFEVTVTNSGILDDMCTAFAPFTYIGQDFGYLIAPTIRVGALNALSSPTVTENYRDNFVKLGVNSISVDVTQDTTATGTDSNPLLVNYNKAAMTFTANDDGTVDYTFGADLYRYGDSVTTNNFIKLPNSEIGPFVADIDPEITLVNDGEVSTVLSLTVNLTGNNQRFGRMRLSNAHGSELLDLQMPMITEYFNGSFYQINADDSCTGFNSPDVNLITDNLSAPGSSTLSVTNSVSVAGNIGITLSAPGAGITGQIDLSSRLSGGVNDNKWLRYDWSANGQFDDDPTASATFGIFSGEDVNIYIQQIFQ